MSASAIYLLECHVEQLTIDLRSFVSILSVSSVTVVVKRILFFSQFFSFSQEVK